MASLVDRQPSRWLIPLFRAPVVLFRLRLGWLFGTRLLLLSHVGRHSGRVRTTVLEVVAHHDDPPVWYVAAAWGDRSDWFRNLIRNPVAEISVGRNRRAVVARVVEPDQAARIHFRYIQEHPAAARIVGRMLGVDLLRSDPTSLAQRIPLVALAGTRAREDLADDVAPVAGTRADTRAAYDRIAPYYEAMEGFWERRARTVGLEVLAPARRSAVFDLGCGPGYTLAQLADSVGPGGTAMGIDISARMCALARQRLQSASPGDRSGVVQADGLQMPFADDTFDFGFLSFTLELFPTGEIPGVLAECRRVLRPGGRLAVVALDKRRPAPLMQRAYQWGHGRFPRVLDCRPIHVQRSLEDSGWTVTEVRELSLLGLPVTVAGAEVPSTHQ